MITVGTPIEDGAISLKFIESAADAIGRASAISPNTTLSS